ncbi:hypothetical protein [Hymenobacter terrenus]|uniref:hypothetical protein n=1 Tax=Hymenobacter terrenus TaxID=1629124 RepID=UPI000619A0A0|nr:hypothetical protein [Hymenobacter terrenus]
MLTCSPRFPALDAIEVFKTNIDTVATGTTVMRALRQRFPALQASLDLDDCDRVLRVLAPQPGQQPWVQVMVLVRSLGVQIEVLPD